MAAKPQLGVMLSKPSLLVNPVRYQESLTLPITESDRNHNPSLCYSSGNYAPGGELFGCREAKKNLRKNKVREKKGYTEGMHPYMPFCPASVIVTSNLSNSSQGNIYLSQRDLAAHGVDDLAKSGHAIVQVMVVGPTGCCTAKACHIAREEEYFGSKVLRNMGLHRELKEGAAFVEVCSLFRHTVSDILVRKTILLL